ncbi:MAG: hypothetical protein ACOYUZ_01815 [Patescibacteria group bacterium]
MLKKKRRGGRVKKTAVSRSAKSGGSKKIPLIIGLTAVIIFIIVFVALVGFVEYVRADKFPKIVLVHADADIDDFKCQTPQEPERIMKVIASAYNSLPGQTDSTPCVTATGYDVCRSYALYGAINTVASNSLPMNSKIKIPELYGDRIFVVRDRMNRRYGGNRIDLWLPTRGEAVSFGTKILDIEVYD